MSDGENKKKTTKTTTTTPSKRLSDAEVRNIISNLPNGMESSIKAELSRGSGVTNYHRALANKVSGGKTTPTTSATTSKPRNGENPPKRPSPNKPNDNTNTNKPVKPKKQTSTPAQEYMKTTASPDTQGSMSGYHEYDGMLQLKKKRAERQRKKAGGY